MIEPFGRRLLLTLTLHDAMELDAHDHPDRFKQIDAVVSELLRLAVGKAKDEHDPSLKAADSALRLATLDPLDDTSRKLISRTFVRVAMEKRGAWFIPEPKSIDVGWLSFAFFQQRRSRFASASIAGTRTNIDVLDRESLFLWSTALPLFDLLWAPFRLRGPESGTKVSADEWRRASDFYRAIGVPMETLAPFLPRSGWSKLDTAGRAEHKSALFDAVVRALKPAAVAAAARMLFLRELAARHYRVGKHGRALRRKVLAKPFQPTLIAYFGGSWLDWLEWIGEPPHPDEEVIEALPSTKLFVETRDTLAEKMESTAKATGSSPARVAEVLTALQGSAITQSPIDERLAVLRQLWRSVDATHRAHDVNQGSLWGLVGERFFHLTTGLRGQFGEPDDRVADRFLPTGVLSQADALWGTCVLARFPDALVFEPFPRAAMAEALGPALRFWHEVALTAWFVSEGPRSRTTLSGLRDHARKLIVALDEFGTPIPPALFDELAKAEQARGEPEQLWAQTVVAGGLSLAVSAGTRLGGYSGFRDIISRHRLAWATSYLDTYLRACWERDLISVQGEVQRRLADKGKPPTAKQFASLAADVANHWFAGDLSRVATAIGIKSPVSPKRNPKLRGSADEFSARMYLRLIGAARADDTNSIAAAAHYAKQAIDIVQRWEAEGEVPDFADGGSKMIDYLRENVFGSASPEDSWTAYIRLIAEELRK